MYVDDLVMICDNQEMKGSSTEDFSEASIDLSSTVGDPGSGAPLYMIICVTTGFVSSSDTGTVQFSVLGDAAVDTIDGSSTVIIETAKITTDLLPIGTVLCIPLPAGLITLRYLGLKCTYATTEVTAGNIDAFIGLHPVLNP